MQCLALTIQDMKMAHKKSSPPVRDIVTLADLAPRHAVTGGSQRRIFGADPITPSPENRKHEMKSSKATSKRAKDLSPRSGGSVKGGKLAANDNVTLVRAAKPTAKQKDLSARKEVIGGKKIV